MSINEIHFGKPLERPGDPAMRVGRGRVDLHGACDARAVVHLRHVGVHYRQRVLGRGV